MEKYDLTYKKDLGPAGVAIMLISAHLYLFYTDGITEDNYTFYLQLSAVIRLFLCAWVFNIAKKLNRSDNDAWGWTILCFFLPAITLVIMSTLKKIRTAYSETVDLDNSLKKDYCNDLELLEKSLNDKLLSEDEYNTALENLNEKYSDLNSELIIKKEHTNREKLLSQLEELKNKGLISQTDYNSKLADLTQDKNS